MPANAVRSSDKLQVVLHVRRVLKRSEENLVEHIYLPGVKMSLQEDSLFERGIVGIWVEQNSPTSARHGDGLGYIKIWATPPKWLVF